jgi:antitoxin component YwqK of YwqJK toxin-antitoxin module
MTNGNDWKNHKLRGRVKSIHSEVANLSQSSGGWIEETRRPLSTIAFNENGCIVKELRYDLDGYLSEIGFTKYDATGNKSEVVFQNQRGGLLTSFVYEYDDAGKLLGCVSTQAHGLIIKQRSRATYDEAGKKAGELWRYEDGTLSRRYVYKYGSNGQLAEQLLYTYDDDGSIEEKITSIYDDKGNVIESACFDKDDRPIEDRTEWKYNDDGEAIETATFDLRGDLYSTTSYSYDFDTQRNWIKRLEVYRIAKTGFETRVVSYRALKYYQP